MRIKAYGYVDNLGWTYLGVGEMEVSQAKQVFKKAGRIFKTPTQRQSELSKLVRETVTEELDAREERRRKADWD